MERAHSQTVAQQHSLLRTDKRGHDTGQSEDGENRKGDKWEDHGKFTPLVCVGGRLNI